MRNILLAFAIFTFASCEKEIEIDLNSTDPKIVIEGNISNNVGPYYVYISKTVNFSETNNYPAVVNAQVIISDNTGTTDTLIEISPGIYRTNKIVGTPGNTYTLKVSAEGKDYIAVSTMPQLVSLDSLRFNVFNNPLGGNENVYTVVPVFTDPATFGNSYRFIQTVNGEEDKSYIVFNDNVNNGSVNQRPIFSAEAEISIGDTVSIEMRCIDNITYTYFYTLSQISGGGAGGGTTPSNPSNNITGNYALGLFTAYTSQKKIEIVK
jgi:hypothetical protein